ncbi:hypothetical protein WL34_01705 [Burkholderia cepacia]|nr:hypothetical protein WL34_01705 [Burkholderia cepacia]
MSQQMQCALTINGAAIVSAHAPAGFTVANHRRLPRRHRRRQYATTVQLEHDILRSTRCYSVALSYKCQIQARSRVLHCLAQRVKSCLRIGEQDNVIHISRISDSRLIHIIRVTLTWLSYKRPSRRVEREHRDCSNPRRNDRTLGNALDMCATAFGTAIGISVVMFEKAIA